LEADSTSEIPDNQMECTKLLDLCHIVFAPHLEATVVKMEPAQPGQLIEAGGCSWMVS